MTYSDSSDDEYDYNEEDPHVPLLAQVGTVVLFLYAWAFFQHVMSLSYDFPIKDFLEE